jgi:hypothetical protein
MKKSQTDICSTIFTKSSLEKEERKRESLFEKFFPTTFSFLKKARK